MLLLQKKIHSLCTNIFHTRFIYTYILIYNIMHIICIKSFCPRNFIIVCVSHDPISGQIPFISQVWFKVRKVRGNCVWDWAVSYRIYATQPHAKICISRHIHTTSYCYYSIYIGISTLGILFRNTYIHTLMLILLLLLNKSGTWKLINWVYVWFFCTF